MHRRLVPAVGLLTVLLASACGDDDAGTAGPQTISGSATAAVIDPGDGGNYAPDIDPANFVDVIDNPYFPMLVGSRWVYEGQADGEAERVEIVATDRRKTVIDIAATVVHDSAYVNDELVEETFDWFAQDRDGNVWYLGEDSKEYEDGEVVSTDGSWEAGVDGALPGIVMPSEPTVGDAFRQEFYAGEAEDMFEIITVGGSTEVPAGRFDDVVTTSDWTPLEPDVIEEKQYAPGVGKLREEKAAGGEDVSELVAFTPGD